MAEDPRNYLYKLYARFLKRYQPRMFVFENVTGIESANNGATWKNIQKYLKRVGYEIECREQNARTFGVLQNRRRMIIVGWLKQSGLKYPDFLEIKTDAIVNDLLADLPKLHPGESSDKYARTKASSYVIGSGIRAKDDVLTLHNSRPNIERDINIYRRAIELWNDGHKRLNYNDLPDELKTHKNRHSFTDRFKVVEGDESYCHTILAHLSKDGHYFIHPDLEQNRSITVREAARIQSFPDSYFFEGPRTSQFMQIGNAVPPMMAKGIAMGILNSYTKEIQMEGNLLLEQFSRYKKLELEASPFHFLLDANIELNPHQINAFCAAIQALKTGGIVLADEVGLGKTIEAGLVLKYVLESAAKRVLIALRLLEKTVGTGT